MTIEYKNKQISNCSFEKELKINFGSFFNTLLTLIFDKIQ